MSSGRSARFARAPRIGQSTTSSSTRSRSNGSRALLDNPIWHALHSSHARFARGSGPARAYPAEVAPFAAVERDGDLLSPHVISEILAPGATVYFAHKLPVLDGSVTAETRPPILQMRWTARELPALDRPTPAIRDLGPAEVEAMLDLTARVFPGYFRQRTPEMGRYVGIVEDGRLTAMGGERLAMTGFCEVSAVCTDPAFTGRGYAHAIVAHVVRRLLDEGTTPFLHVDMSNTRAQAIYRSLGFGESAEVRLMRVRRT